MLLTDRDSDAPNKNLSIEIGVELSEVDYLFSLFLSWPKQMKTSLSFVKGIVSLL